MAKTVRKGASYMVAHSTPMWPGPAIGTIVKVVNLPGGSKGGIFRNVEDEHGNIHFVNIRHLAQR